MIQSRSHTHKHRESKCGRKILSSSSPIPQKSLKTSTGPVYGSVMCNLRSAWTPLELSARARPPLLPLLLARSRPVPVSGASVVVSACVGVDAAVVTGDDVEVEVWGACAGEVAGVCFRAPLPAAVGVLLPDSLPLSLGLPGVLPTGVFPELPLLVSAPVGNESSRIGGT
jgi:hypothetical protein